MSKADVMLALERAIACRGMWSTPRASIVSWTWALANRVTVDWDADAGEDWIRLKADRELVAQVAVPLPIAVVSQEFSGEWPFPVTVIAVGGFSDPSLMCSQSVLERAFEQPERLHSLDPAAVSALDLWFATV